MCSFCCVEIVFRIGGLGFFCAEFKSFETHGNRFLAHAYSFFRT